MGPYEVRVRAKVGEIGGKFSGEELTEALELDGGNKRGAIGG